MLEGMTDIINDIVIHHAFYTKRDIEQYFSERNILLFEHKEIFSDEDFVLYESKENGQILPRVNLPIPYYLQSAEKQCLREIATDEIANKFLHENTIQKVKENIPQDIGEINFYRNRQKKEENQEISKIRMNIRILMKAILENRRIRVRIGQEYLEILPYKLCYSNRDDKVQLLGIGKNTGRYFHIEDLEEIELQNEIKEIQIAEWLAQQKRELQLQIEDKKNVVERCFSMFSHLKKRAVYNREENQYQMYIEYYLFEEKELIKDILSFGSYVIVKEPQDLRDEMIKRIKENLLALDCYIPYNKE